MKILLNLSLFLCLFSIFGILFLLFMCIYSGRFIGVDGAKEDESKMNYAVDGITFFYGTEFNFCVSFILYRLLRVLEIIRVHRFTITNRLFIEKK